METDNIEQEKSRILKVSKIALFLIFLGFAARIIMLIFYYFIHSINPGRSWGDAGSYFKSNRQSSPLTIFFLEIIRFLSFGYIEIFVFWWFLWDILTCIIFYFVLKSFDIKNRVYIYSLFLINPFYFLNNSFSLENCGYHITDAFFFFFLFLALIFYKKEDLRSRYAFYIFLGLSICAKYYTFPVIGLFLIKFLYNKDWGEFKIFLITIIPLVITLLIIPLFIWREFSEAFLNYTNTGYGSNYPLYIKIIPALIIFLLFCFFRIKKSDLFEIIIISIIATGTFLFFTYPYLRWFQALLFYGFLKEREFSKLKLRIGSNEKDIKIDNHFITFILSLIAVFISYLIIIYVL